MKAYSTTNEEALRARELLKDWAGEGFITAEQHQRMQQETVCDLRRTNIFLRLVIFFFTIIIIAAGIGLFLLAFATGASESAAGPLLLILGAGVYGAAEFAASRRFYRHGVEEGLAVCAIPLLCLGTYVILKAAGSLRSDETEFLIPLIGTVASLWVWHRFGLANAFLAAMIFVPWLAACWTSTHSMQHMIIAGLYAAGLIGMIVVRTRHRFDYLDKGYSIAEALLWLGIYLAVNLQLSSSGVLRELFDAPGAADDVSRNFYWITWALTWCLPPVVLYRGLRAKDRFVIATGGIVAILTLITNKSYLGWPRHTWDPMLLGGLLVGVALFLNRWLANGPGEIRNGFTAKRLSGKDKRGMNIASAAFGLAASQAATINPGPDPHFGGGGESGGGGASSGF